MVGPVGTLSRLLGLASSAVLALGVACDKSKGGDSDEPVDDLGYSDPSSEDLAPLPAALADDDLAGSTARAETLWKMQRATRIGERVFAAKLGVTNTRFTSVAQVDGGGASGQVEFWRWDDESLADGQASASEARQWLLVPITFDPDTNLEPEQRQGGPDGEQERVLAAVLVARAALEQELPNGRFDAYAFREQAEYSGKVARQTRVYLLGSNNESPDVELTVTDAHKRNKPPVVADRRTHMDAGKLSALPLATSVTPPGPSTIMRARAISGATSKPTEVLDGTGNTWHFDPATAAFVQGPAPKSSKKKKK